jgi:hypothetical protein
MGIEEPFLSFARKRNAWLRFSGNIPNWLKVPKSERSTVKQ